MTTNQLTERDGRPRVLLCGTLLGLASILKPIFVISIIFGLQGCADRDEPPEITKQAVKFDEVPDVVRNAASKAVPGVKLNEAWKNLGPGGKLHSYEIRGKNPADGKTRETRVSLTGEILELE